ncbi:hypothetical protein tb265_31260 [Gemmatimonadetes bacterium T265]|nr:hypothetical protein tb265_31260 [Gemmatimonadetes bacterium T265]
MAVTTGADHPPGLTPFDSMTPHSVLRRSFARRTRTGFCVALLAPLGAVAAQVPATPAANATAPQTTSNAPQPTSGVTPLAVPTLVTAYTPDATRAQLTARRDSLARFDTTSTAGRARRDEIDEIRNRLTNGDFRPGDRFLVQDLLLARTVSDRPTAGDTVVVRDGVSGPVYSLNAWPDGSLRGVLRAELPTAVEAYERTYVRDPRLRVVPLTRLSITGSVPRPGYYVVDADRQLTDAITLAGGPGAASQKKGRITVMRGTKRLYDTKQVQTAIRDGRTLDDLGIRSGDEVRIEEPKQSSFPSVQTIFWGVTAITGLLALIRSLYNSN